MALIAGAVSQVLMLAVVAGGYWFTVRPVFQHQLLQEKAAQFELDIRSKEEHLRSLESTAALTEEKISRFSQELQQTEDRLERARWQLFVIEFRQQTFPAWLNDLVLSDPNNWHMQDIRLEIVSDPDPYQNLVDAVETMRTQNEGANDYPERFYARTLAHIESKRDFLACEAPNVESLNDTFRKEKLLIAAEYRNKMSDLATQPMTDADERREQTKLSEANLDKQFNLHAHYRSVVYDLIGQCTDNRDAVLQELSKLQR